MHITSEQPKEQREQSDACIDSAESRVRKMKSQLKGSYSEGDALLIYNKVKETGEWLPFLKTFLHDEDYQVARNALWGLTKASDEELSSLQPMLHELIDKAMNHENSSVRRLSMNIIVRLKMEEDDLRTDFLDFCLEHMASPAETPGVQTLCMKLAHRFCGFYPELMKEFTEILQMMDSDYAICVKCLRKKMLTME